MNEDRRQGQRAGINWAIAKLRSYAETFADDDIAGVLRAVALRMAADAYHLRQGRIDDEITPVDVGEED